jgi:transposase-like protein
MEGIRRTYSEEFKKDAVGHSLTSDIRKGSGRSSPGPRDCP